MILQYIYIYTYIYIYIYVIIYIYIHTRTYVCINTLVFILVAPFAIDPGPRQLGVARCSMMVARGELHRLLFMARNTSYKY